MARDDKKKVAVRLLLDDHGRTYAQEAGISLGDEPTPAPLFQLLVAANLMSARIGSDIAVAAARSLFDRGWTTPDNLLDSTWQQRVDALGDASYTRYDESTATRLCQCAELLNDRWGGDLRNLRDEADRDPQRIHELLQEFNGVGPTGADIFCREIQHAWDELHPYADDRALDTAGQLGLPKSPEGLAELVSMADMPRLVAALIRVGNDADVREQLDSQIRDAA